MADDFASVPVRFVPKDKAVHAMQWTGQNWDEISTWVYGSVVAVPEDEYDGDNWPVAYEGNVLSVLERDQGENVAAAGEWLIKDEAGDWWVGDDTFLERFQPDISGSHVTGEDQ